MGDEWTALEHYLRAAAGLSVEVRDDEPVEPLVQPFAVREVPA
jgi:hypothetical protein